MRKSHLQAICCTNIEGYCAVIKTEELQITWHAYHIWSYFVFVATLVYGDLVVVSFTEMVIGLARRPSGGFKFRICDPDQTAT